MLLFPTPLPSQCPSSAICTVTWPSTSHAYFSPWSSHWWGYFFLWKEGKQTVKDLKSNLSESVPKSTAVGAGVCHQLVLAVLRVWGRATWSCTSFLLLLVGSVLVGWDLLTWLMASRNSQSPRAWLHPWGRSCMKCCLFLCALQRVTASGHLINVGLSNLGYAQ